MARAAPRRRRALRPTAPRCRGRAAGPSPCLSYVPPQSTEDAPAFPTTELRALLDALDCGELGGAHGPAAAFPAPHEGGADGLLPALPARREKEGHMGGRRSSLRGTRRNGAQARPAPWPARHGRRRPHSRVRGRVTPCWDGEATAGGEDGVERRLGVDRRRTSRIRRDGADGADDG